MLHSEFRIGDFMIYGTMKAPCCTAAPTVRREQMGQRFQPIAVQQSNISESSAWLPSNYSLTTFPLEASLNIKDMLNLLEGNPLHGVPPQTWVKILAHKMLSHTSTSVMSNTALFLVLYHHSLPLLVRIWKMKNNLYQEMYIMGDISSKGFDVA